MRSKTDGFYKKPDVHFLYVLHLPEYCGDGRNRIHGRESAALSRYLRDK